MNEILEKLEHGLMLCEASGTTLVHMEKDDAEKIIRLLKNSTAEPPMMFCSECRGDIDLKSRFCPHCGAKIFWPPGYRHE